MKIIPFRLIVAFFTMGIFLFTSCDKEENNSSEEVNFNSENSTRAAKMDNIAEGTFNIMEQAFVENETGGRGVTQFSLFPACTEITVGFQGNVFTILLDFGASCTLNNGNVVSGSIL